MSHPNAQALVMAFSMATQLASRTHRHRHDECIAQLQATSLKDMVEAIVTRRVNAVEAQCHAVLTMYAEQADSYMKERLSLADKMQESRDTRLRLEIRSRLTEIDSTLAEIRADAKLVFERMGELLLAIGSSAQFANGFSTTLELAPQRLS